MGAQRLVWAAVQDGCLLSFSRPCQWQNYTTKYPISSDNEH